MIVHHAWHPIQNEERIEFNHVIINDFNHCLANDLTTDESYALMTNLRPWFRLGPEVNPFDLDITQFIGYRVGENNYREVLEMLRNNGYTLGAENTIRSILGITCATIMIPNQITNIYRMEISLICDIFPP